MIDPAPAETAKPPALAVILATDCFATVRPVVAALRRQEGRERIELVLVSPPRALGRIEPGETEGFAAVRRVEVPSVLDLAAARAAGVRAATAPIVFLGETHSYAAPGWLEALLRAFEHPWAAVVPQVDNANRTTAVSWASYLLDYSPWGPGRPAGEIDDPLIYNSAYRRQVLLEFGDQLEQMLEPMWERMPSALRERGHRVWFEPAAKVLHLHVTRLGAMLREKFYAGLLLAGNRWRRWPRRRRVIYFLAQPLIPALLVWRVRKTWTRARTHGPLPWGTLLLVITGATAKGAGELSGILVGTRRFAVAGMNEIEVHKARFAGR